MYKNLEFLSSGFRGAIQKFDNEFPVRDIRLTVKPLESYDYLAETTPPMNYKMEISINKDRLTELPNLLLAHLFIHETVHSQMFSKLLTIMKNGGDIEGMTAAQWTEKLNKKEYAEQMAVEYVNTMAELLSDYDGGFNTMQYYQDIAWEGLMWTETYNNKSDTEKNRIVNTIKNLWKNGNKTCN